MGKRAWLMVLLVAFGVAMLKCGSWAAFRPEDMMMAPRDDVYKHLLIFAQVAVLCAGVLVSRKVDARRFLGIVPVSASALVMSLTAAAHLAFPSVEGLAVLYGAALASMLLGWGVVACSVAPRISALGVTMGFALYSILVSSLGMMESGFPEAVALVIAVVAPLVSGLLLAVLVAKGAKTLDVAVFKPWAGTMVEQLRLVPRQPLIALALCTVATRLISVFSDGWMALMDTGHILLLLPLVYLLLLALLLVWFLVLKNDSPLNLWPVLILISFMGLVAFSSLNGYGINLAAGFATAISFCINIFVWYFVCSFVFAKGLSAVPFFGVAYMFVSFSPKAMHALLDPLLDSMSPDAVSLLGTVCIAATAVALVVMAFIMLLSQVRQAGIMEPDETGQDTEIVADALNSNGNGPDGGNAPLSEDAFPALDSLVGRFGLSSREAEVLQLVLRGYTWPMVADELYISLNTAQSHQRNIYRKLGVHKKRELIELCR